MDGHIRLLPDAVANQIAAGEVVQRPASVVKELLENAVDAGASDITLKTTDAGRTLIQVIDNGQGMGPADAKMCFERHATSKISNTKDIFSIITKGFRGEALASIAAVAQVELISRRSDSEIAESIKIAGSQFGECKAVAAPVGTNMSVKNLFFNVPARRKFLKSDSVENKHIIEEYFRLALAHPDRQFKLIQNERVLYNNSPANHKQRIVQLFGSTTDEKLAPISEETNLFNLQGFIVKPKYARKSRGEQYVFVNERFIKSSYLHHAIVAAYEGLIEKDAHPGYFLYFTIDPASIDINIHPTKTEIKFEDERAMYQLLKSIVKRSLGMYNLAPSIDFTNLSGIEFTPVQNRNSSTSQNNTPSNGNPFKSFRTEADHAKALELIEQEDKPILSPSEEAIAQNLIEGQQNEQQNNTIQGKSLVCFDKFLVWSRTEDLWLIHIKRAQQSIVYSNFKDLKNVVSSQGALFEEVLQVRQEDQVFLENHLSTLAQMGITLECFGKDQVILRTVPSGFHISTVAELVESFINELHHSESLEAESVRDIMAKRLALASSLHFKLGNNHDVHAAFVQKLFSTESPSLSPFGKAVFKPLNSQELEKILG